MNMEMLNEMYRNSKDVKYKVVCHGDDHYEAVDCGDSSVKAVDCAFKLKAQHPDCKIIIEKKIVQCTYDFMN